MSRGILAASGLTALVSCCRNLRRRSTPGDERTLARMHVAMPHCVRDAVDAFAEILCTATQQTAHFVDFFPVPLVLSFSTELPHRRDLLLLVVQRAIASSR
jgi:hypothetical protein